MRYRVIALALLVTWLLGPNARPVAADEICFPDQTDITNCLQDPFSDYWQDNGGLAVFGYPITPAQDERNPDLDVDLRTQWTERNRFESHPENEPPYTILLGRMGAERLAQLERDPAQEGREEGPEPGCLWFEETGHNVCDQAEGQGFKTYWESNGLNIPELDPFNRSLQLFGLPLTAAQMETNSSGDTVMTQWFERARFEWHPDNPEDFTVLLGLLGNELRAGLTDDPGDDPGDDPSDDPGGTGETGTSIFGVEVSYGKVGAILNQAQEANVSWVRYNGVRWNEVEATEGVRDWSQLDQAAAELQALAAAGTTPMVIVRNTPEWAQRVPGALCGPIAEEALDDFANFMGELVARYSQEPYNIKYWELGNEPDVDPDLLDGPQPFGCWGDSDDPYYGGSYYAEMLKQVYPAVKQADPEAQVVIGGLLLDCDPSNPPAGETCLPSRFLEGILQNGGGAAFDMVGYHAYMFWGPVTLDWDRESPSWAHRGGALLGKLDFIRTVMAEYGVDKPVIMNEGGLLCYPAGPPCQELGDFYGNQANYAVRLYSRAWANDLQGAVWYTLNGPGWNEGGLLDAAQAPRPAFGTVQFMANLLDGAEFAGSLSDGAVEGYAFRTGDTTYQVYWTNDETVVDLPVPEGTQGGYNYLGQPVEISGPNVAVSFEPLLLEVQQP